MSPFRFPSQGTGAPPTCLMRRTATVPVQNKDYWYPWFPVKFRRKTIQLTRDQRHIYRDLIDWYMETGEALPNAPSALANITGISLKEWEGISFPTDLFFKLGSDGLLHNRTCDEQLLEQARRDKERHDNAKHAAEIRWGKQDLNAQRMHYACSEHAKAMLNDATPQPQTTPQPHDSNILNHNLTKGEVNGFSKINLDFRNGGFEEGFRFMPSERTQQDIISIAPGWNIQTLVEHYTEFVRQHGRPEHPQAAFKGWAKSFTKGKPPR